MTVPPNAIVETRPGALARRLAACALAAAALLPLPALAIYKCVDPAGKVTYQDDICPKGGTERRIESESRRARDQDAAAAAETNAADDAKKRAAPEPAKPRDADEASCQPMAADEIDAERSRNAARVAITMRVNGADNVRFEPFVHARLKCADGMREFACGKASARNAAGKFDAPKVWLFALTPESYLTWTEDERGDARKMKRMSEAAAACFKFGT